MAETKSNVAAEPESFESALNELEQLVSGLEAGDVPLEKSLEAFERGQKLIQFCEQKLQTVEKAIKQLNGDADESQGAAR